jgi:hypothetical protein
MEEHSGDILWVDPIANKPDDKSLLEDLDNYLKKRNSPNFIFIDSLDYTRWSFKDVVWLVEKYEGKKGFVFIMQSSKNGSIRKQMCLDTYFHGDVGILVRDFIATPDKNRYSRFTPLVVFEEMARQRNPLFFEKQLKKQKS